MDKETDKTQDTFYYKKILLLENQFVKVDSDLTQQMNIKQPFQWQGCCDGMPVRFLLIRGNDTSSLNFRNPNIKSDTIGFKITKKIIDNFRSLSNDSIINDYLNDVESYLDDSKKHIQFTESRAIIKLRKIEYSR